MAPGRPGFVFEFPSPFVPFLIHMQMNPGSSSLKALLFHSSWGGRRGI